MKLACPVPGCTTTWATHNLHFVDHYRSEHVSCACGFVGVSWSRHLAQRQRRGFGVWKCRVTRRFHLSEAEIAVARCGWSKAAKLQVDW